MAKQMYVYSIREIDGEVEFVDIGSAIVGLDGSINIELGYIALSGKLYVTERKIENAVPPPRGLEVIRGGTT